MHDRSTIAWGCALFAVWGCGRTDVGAFAIDGAGGDDGHDGHDIIVRCPGKAWAGNSDGELVLLDLDQRRAALYGTLPVGTWALASVRSTGELWVVEAVGSNPSVWRYDPFADEGTLETAWTTNANADRAGTDETGRLWAMLAPSDAIRVFDAQTRMTSDAPLSAGEIPSGGDLVVESDRVYVLWWPGTMLVLAREGEQLDVVDMQTLPSDPDKLVSGAVVERGVLWLATRDGEVLGVELEGRAPGTLADFTVPFALHDLAPVYADSGACPEV